MSVPTLSSPDRQRRWRLFILIVGGTVTAAMLYGSGMRSQKRFLAQVREEKKQVVQDLRAAQLALQGRDALVQQLEARRQIDLALQALDARNFGIAAQRVAEAGQRLETAENVHAASAGALASQIGALQALKFDATPDVGAQRSALLTIVGRIDAELAKVAPAPDAVTPLTVKPPTANDIPQIHREIGR